MSVAVHTKRNRDRCHVGRRFALLLVAVSALASGAPITAQEPAVGSFEVITEKAVRGDDIEAPEPKLSFRFRFAPWEDVLTKFADVAGLTLDLTDIPTGTFNYYDQGQYSPREALDILNGYLLQRGFVLVRRDRFLVCVSLEKGIPANLIPTVTVDRLADYGNNELVNTIFTHADMDPALAASQVEQLQGPHGKVVSLTATNALLVTDTASNLRLIQSLLEQGAFRHRATGGNAGPDFKSFALQYVRADEAERLVRTMFGLPSSRTSATASPSGPSSSPDLTTATDARTNRLFVTASPAKLASIEQIIADYDLADATAEGGVQRARTIARIVPLPNADVVIIGQALESLSPRIRVSTTRGTRSSAMPDVSPNRAAAGDSPQKASAGARPPLPTAPSPDGRDR